MITGRQVLIAEDNPADVRLIQEAVKGMAPGLNLHIARDGEEALDFVFRRNQFTSAPRPNLIFLDFNLPRADSRVVLRQIKQDPDLRSIPVVVFTSSVFGRDIQEAYQLFANCYIRKPSDLDQFINTVRATVDFWLNTTCLVSDK